MLKRPGVHALHVYGPAPRLVDGAERDAPIANVEAYLAGNSRPDADIHVAGFRDDKRNVLAVLEESC